MLQHMLAQPFNTPQQQKMLNWTANYATKIWLIFEVTKALIDAIVEAVCVVDVRQVVVPGVDKLVELCVGVRVTRAQKVAELQLVGFVMATADCIYKNNTKQKRQSEATKQRKAVRRKEQLKSWKLDRSIKMKSKMIKFGNFLSERWAFKKVICKPPLHFLPALMLQLGSVRSVALLTPDQSQMPTRYSLFSVA